MLLMELTLSREFDSDFGDLLLVLLGSIFFDKEVSLAGLAPNFFERS